MSLLIPDIVQMISQYCPQVYCKLRLVSKEVKEMVDEVLPNFVEIDTFYHNGKRRRISNNQKLGVRFLRVADCCGCKLLNRNNFDAWMDYMMVVYGKDERYGDRVEKFCRDYLPKDGFIRYCILDFLCTLNRKKFVKELWKEADPKKRFFHRCIRSVCMIDDLEFVKVVYEYFSTRITFDDVKIAVSNASLRSRWQIVYFLVEKNPMLKKLGTGLNQRFTLALRHWDAFEHMLSPQREKDVIISYIKQNGLLLVFADESIRKDREVVMEAVKSKAWTLEFADESLKKDKEIVMQAVRQCGDVLNLVDESLRKDKEIILEAVKENGTSLKYCDESIRKDRKIVMEAVKSSGWALEVTDISFRKDKEVVMEAVKQCGSVLQFADDSLLKDKQVVMQAVKQNGFSLKYCDESLRKDRKIVMQAVKQNGWALEIVDTSFRKDMAVVIEAVKECRSVLPFIDASFLNQQGVLRVLEEMDKGKTPLPTSPGTFLSFLSRQIGIDENLLIDTDWFFV